MLFFLDLASVASADSAAKPMSVNCRYSRYNKAMKECRGTYILRVWFFFFIYFLSVGKLRKSFSLVVCGVSCNPLSGLTFSSISHEGDRKMKRLIRSEALCYLKDMRTR